MSDSDLPHLEGELENLIRLIPTGFSDRNCSVIVCFFGFDGTGKKTLEAVGQKFGVTRERVRQITSNFALRVQKKRALYLPVFRSACNHIIGALPNSPQTIGQSLREQGIARTEFDVSSISAILRLLNEDEFFEVVSIGDSTLAVHKNTAESLRRVPRIARAIVSAFGCGHIEHILGGLEAGLERAIETQDIEAVLSQIADVRWLDQARKWFTIVDTKRNRLSNIVQKVLSVAQKISLSELRGAIKRVHRLDGFAPPSNILRAFCSSLPYCDIEDEDVIANMPLSVADTLGGIERCFWDVLREHGSVMNLNTLRDECFQRGMNANSFYQYLMYSPIICRLVREIYSLVGAEVPPGIVEELSQPAIRGSVLVGDGWTDDGRIWISYRLNVSNVRSGAFSLAPMQFCVVRMAEMINAHVVTYSTRLGIQQHTTAGQVHKIRQAIEERKTRLLDDFAHGMMGSNRMKKDPVISVVNTQTNSPGAIQQTGFGNFSQAAFTQQHQPLVAAIDRAIRSPEFAALQPAQKDAFRDIADTLKDEAAKQTPDAGKLKRWGSRLVELGRELGLRVATSEITTVLQNIFGGG
jgi:sigma-70-like protein